MTSGRAAGIQISHGMSMTAPTPACGRADDRSMPPFGLQRSQGRQIQAVLVGDCALVSLTATSTTRHRGVSAEAPWAQPAEVADCAAAYDGFQGYLPPLLPVPLEQTAV